MHASFREIIQDVPPDGQVPGVTSPPHRQSSPVVGCDFHLIGSLLQS